MAQYEFTTTIEPSTTRAFKIFGRWYWVTEIDSTLPSGSQFVMTVAVAKDPRYAQLGYGKLRYVQTSQGVPVRAQDAPVWDWVTRRLGG
jgi:hypothetical protein